MSMFLDLFKKADKSLDVAWRWGAAIAALATAFTWVAKQMSWADKLNWADAVFIGVGAALLISLIMSAALVAWRIFNPLARLPTKPELDYVPVPEASELQGIKIKIENLEIELSKSKDGMLKQDKESKNQARKLELLSQMAVRFQANNKEHLDIFEHRIKELETDYKKHQIFEAETVTKISILESDLRQHRISVHRRFEALFDRERMAMFADNIQISADELSNSLLAGKRLDADQWKDWLSTESVWRSNTGYWIERAEKYVPKIGESIWMHDNDKYEGKWKVDHNQFVTPTDIHKYKTFRIAFQNWQDARKLADNLVRKVAFEAFEIKKRD